MANERGHYGNNGTRVGQVPIYVEREHSSIGKWLLGAVAVGGAVLYARHQSRQIEQLYRTSGVPYQTFTGTLRESARALPTRAREAYRGFTGRFRSASSAVPTESSAPTHSVRSRSRSGSR